MNAKAAKRIRKYLKVNGVDVKTWDGRDTYKIMKKMNKSIK